MADYRTTFRVAGKNPSRSPGNPQHFTLHNPIQTFFHECSNLRSILLPDQQVHAAALKWVFIQLPHHLRRLASSDPVVDHPQYPQTVHGTGPLRELEFAEVVVGPSASEFIDGFSFEIIEDATALTDVTIFGGWDLDAFMMVPLKAAFTKDHFIAIGLAETAAVGGYLVLGTDYEGKATTSQLFC